MPNTRIDVWREENQRYLMASLAEVGAGLDRHAADGGAREEPEPDRPAWDHPAPPALEVVCQRFGLSSFERAVLLLCAGMELDSGFAARCAAAQGDPARRYPTFSLALAA